TMAPSMSRTRPECKASRKRDMMVSYQTPGRAVVPREVGPMSKVDYRNIEKIPDLCGGRAVVAGTRIRVSVILTCYRQGMTVEEIVQQYPHLRPADVHDALAYA